MKQYVRKMDVKCDCPIEVALNVFSGKWKPAILCALNKRPHTTKEFLNDLPCCNRRVLLQQLYELESDGIVSRKIYAQIPLKVEYSFTDLGRSLMPVLKFINDWGVAYSANIQLTKLNENATEHSFQQPT